MEGLQGWRKELPMVQLNTKADLDQWAIGSDKDIGGFSTASLDITPEGTGRFHGNISLELPADRNIEQSGYAAIRSKVRTSQRGSQPRMMLIIYFFYRHEKRPCLVHHAGTRVYSDIWLYECEETNANILSTSRPTALSRPIYISIDCFSGHQGNGRRSW